jgi:hypothetical protein
MRLARALLLIAAAVFIGIGVVFLFAPVEWARVVEIELPTPVSRTDLRATYGGFDLGFGVFLALCALRPAWIRPGLAAMAIALAGFAGGRAYGILVDGCPTMLMPSFALMEASGSILAFLAYRRAAPGAGGTPSGGWSRAS